MALVLLSVAQKAEISGEFLALGEVLLLVPVVNRVAEPSSQASRAVRGCTEHAPEAGVAAASTPFKDTPAATHHKE